MERANGNAESSDSKHSKIAAYTESETFRSMPQSVIDRLMSHNKTRFSNMKMSEENIDSIVLKAARETLDLDLSGSQLTGEAPYFLLDSLSRNEFVNFVHVNLSSSEISPSGFSVLIDYFIYFNALETLNVRNNSLPKESGVAIAKILGGSSPLKLLDASGNSLGDAGIAAIAGAFTVDLSQLGMPDVGMFATGPRTRISLQTLTVLDLSRNNFGDGGLLALCRGLTHFMKAMLSSLSEELSDENTPVACLRVLRLSNNRCGEKAASCLAQFLESFYRPGYIPLEELSLNKNPLGEGGVLALLRSLQPSEDTSVTRGHTPSLKKLGLGECGCGSLEILEEAAKMITDCGLQDLDLTINDDDAQHLCSSSMFVDTVVSLADAVSKPLRPVTSLALGNLAEAAKKEASTMLPGSTAYYALRVALDSFRSIRENINVGSRRLPYRRSDSEDTTETASNSVTALKLQQEDFENLRKEHSTAFLELSKEISRIPNVELQKTLKSALKNIDSSAGAEDDRRSVQKKNSSTPGGTGKDIATLVKEEVAKALGNQKEINDKKIDDQIQQVLSRVDVLQEQMQAIDSQAFRFASEDQCEELNRLAIQLETRIARLESRLDHLELGTSRHYSDSQTAMSEERESVMKKFEALSARMTALENSVEAEHETSLDLLDVLLLSKGKDKEKENALMPSSYITPRQSQSHSNSQGGEKHHSRSTTAPHSKANKKGSSTKTNGSIRRND